MYWLYTSLLLCCIQAVSSQNCPPNFSLALVHLEPLAPEIRQFFNIKGTQGYIKALKKDNGKFSESDCTLFSVDVVNIKEDTELAIYEQEEQRRLKEADVILGPKIKGIQAFISRTDCKECFAFYFLTTPVGLSTERWIADTFLRTDAQLSNTFSLWPSPSSFINSVVGNTILYTKHVSNKKQTVKVVILANTQTEDAIRYIAVLSEKLRKKNMDVKILDLYLIAKTASNLDNVSVEDILQVHKRLKQIERMMYADIPPHFVIFYMDDSQDVQIKTLSMLLSKRGGLDRKGTSWLIAEMDFFLNPGAGEKLTKLIDNDVVNIELLVTYPCVHPDILAPSEMLGMCLHPFRYEKSIEIQGVTVGKQLLQNVFKGPSYSSNDTLAILKKILQADCPQAANLNLNLTREKREDEEFLECPEVGTIRRVGFPQYETIWTKALYTTEPDAQQRTSVYMPTDWLETLSLHGDTSTTGEIIHVEDFFVMGYRKNDAPYAAVLVEQSPFVIIGSKNTYSGMCVDIYNAVVMKLVKRGIILNLRFYNTSTYGSLNQGKWSGVFGELTEENKPDGIRTVLGIGYISQTKQRLEDERFTFSQVFAHGSLTYMTRKLAHENNLQFLRPFTSGVWLMLLLVFVISAIHLCFMSAWNPFGEQLPVGSSFNMRESLWHSFLVVTQAGAPFGAVHFPARIYSVFFWFFALVVVGCYTGNLTGFLTETQSYVPSISELLNKGGYKFGMLKNSSISDTQIGQMFGHQIDEKIDHSNLELVDSYSEGIEKVKTENFILFGTNLLLEYFQNTDPECGLHVHNEPSFYGHRIEALAFPMRADWPVADDFKLAMNELKESGELQLIYRKWISSDRKCGRKLSLDDRRLAWINFLGLYILTAVGVFISYICLAFKLGHLKLKERRETNEEETADSTEKLSVIELTETAA